MTPIDGTAIRALVPQHVAQWIKTEAEERGETVAEVAGGLLCQAVANAAAAAEAVTVEPSVVTEEPPTATQEWKVGVAWHGSGRMVVMAAIRGHRYLWLGQMQNRWRIWRAIGATAVSQGVDFHLGDAVQVVKLVRRMIRSGS